MWKPYIKMIAEQIPAALHVLDRFRIMRNMNVAIDEVRRAEAAQMKRDGYEPILPKSRFLYEATDGQVIAINGKTLRGSFDEANNKSAIHMISAWASANSISLGQLVVDAKSNEITAIPKLLDMLQLKGATVTIDAAGCQTEIARRIVDAGGHYVLNVKGNQVTLRDGIEKFFAEYLDGQMPTVPVRQRHSTNTGHGRRESRWHYVCGVPRDLPDRDRWPGLKAIGMVISNTERDGKECGSIR